MELMEQIYLKLKKALNIKEVTKENTKRPKITVTDEDLKQYRREVLLYAVRTSSWDDPIEERQWMKDEYKELYGEEK